MTPEEIRAERDQLSNAIQFMVQSFQQKTGAMVKELSGSNEVEEVFADGSHFNVFRLSIEITI